MIYNLRRPCKYCWKFFHPFHWAQHDKMEQSASLVYLYFSPGYILSSSCHQIYLLTFCPQDSSAWFQYACLREKKGKKKKFSSNFENILCLQLFPFTLKSIVLAIFLFLWGLKKKTFQAQGPKTRHPHSAKIQLKILIRTGSGVHRLI